MVQGCCVLGCPSTVRVPNHKFPSKLEDLERWSNSIRLFKQNPLSLDDFKHLRVCYLHFKESNYCSGAQRKLKRKVCPTLNLPSINQDTCSILLRDVPVYVLEVEIGSDGISRAVSDPIYDEPTPKYAEPGPRYSESNSNCAEPEPIYIEPDHSYAEQDNNHAESDHNYAMPGPSCSQVHLATSEKTKGLKASKCKRLPMIDKKILEPVLPLRADKLYAIASSMRKKQLRMHRNQLIFKRRLREAEKYNRSQAIKKIRNKLPAYQRTIIDMQIRNSNYNPKGRSFTLEEKILSLTLYKQSGKYYRFLQNIFSLPSGKCLRSMLNKIRLKTGHNKFMIEYLKNEVEKMSDMDKVCCLIWSEMALQPHIDYDHDLDCIIGFEDYGARRVANYADRVLVFMIKGIDKGWKLPIAYFFSGSQTNTECLVTCIIKITKILVNCGLNPVAYVCNQSKPNVEAINQMKLQTSLKFSTQKEYTGSIHIFGHWIIPLYDPSHLIKEVRNNMLKKDLELDYRNKQLNGRRFASWKIIELAYDIDTKSKSIYRLMPKLTIEHVNDKYIKKRRVKNAAQIFSRTVAAFIDHHTKIDGKIDTSIGPLSMPKKEGSNTAEALFLFDQIFDSVNGSSFKRETSLRTIITNDSQHHKFWKTAINKLNDMRFVDINSKCPINTTLVLKNWILTLKGFQMLWKMLRNLGFKYLKGRNLSQDSLENFFNLIYSLNPCHNNQTCSQFQSSFKILLLNNLSSCKSIGNCKTNCNGNLLFTIENLFTQTVKENNNESCDNNCMNDDIILEDLKNVNSVKFLKTHILKKIISKLGSNKEINSCTDCKLTLINPNLNKLLEQMYAHIIQSLPNNCYKRDVSFILKTISLANVDFSVMKCPHHRVIMMDSYVKYAVIFIMSSWCEFVNQIFIRKQQHIAVNTHPIYRKAFKMSQYNLLKPRKFI